MNFREFLLNEDRHYYAYKTPDGQYQVSSQFYINPKERDKEASEVKKEINPSRLWKFSIKPGDHKLNVPDATAQDEEQIGLAYYRRMFGNYTPHLDIEDDSEGDIIAPRDFDPNYGKRKKVPTKLSVSNLDNTINYSKLS